MIVACAIDRNYAELAGVMLYSLRLNGAVPDAKIVILGDGLKAGDKRRLEACAGRPIRFIDLTAEMLALIAPLRTTSYWSRSTYSRLILPSLLEDKSERILYLDADVLVMTSLRPLVELDLGGALMAGVDEVSPKRNRALGRDPDMLYFNAGVLMIESGRWNSENLTEKAFSLLQSRRFEFLDQDVLNLLGEGRVLALDGRWNSRVPAEAGKAFIIHFVHAKPNTKACTHPAKAIFLDYRQATPWANKRLRNGLDRFLHRIGHSIAKRLRRLKAGRG